VAPKGVRRTGLLSPSEAEVYSLLMQGLSNEAIGQRLGIDVKAVRMRLIRLRRAYGVRTDRQLYALRIAELEQRLADGPGGTPGQPC
jgi:DNA-binding CsgD family transcriptional regulator